MTKYTVTVDEEVWRKFKRTITKDRTINQAIVELIKREVAKKENDS